MNAAIADCLVIDYEPLIPGLDLPDANDRHVLAAAIRCAGQVIVTANLRDFPAERLSVWGVEAQHPDDFVLGLIDLAPGAVASIVVQQAGALKNPQRTPAQLLDTLREQGLVRSVARLREVLGVVAE